MILLKVVYGAKKNVSLNTVDRRYLVFLISKLTWNFNTSKYVLFELCCKFYNYSKIN